MFHGGAVRDRGRRAVSRLDCRLDFLDFLQYFVSLFARQLAVRYRRNFRRTPEGYFCEVSD